MKAKWKRYIAQKFQQQFLNVEVFPFFNRSARIIIPVGNKFDIYRISYANFSEVYDDGHDFDEIIEFYAVFEDFDAVDEDNPNPYFSVNANNPAEFLNYLFSAYSIESLVKMRIEFCNPLAKIG